MRPILFVLLFFSFWAQSQYQDKVDFLRADVFIELIPKEKRVTGDVMYEFIVLKNVDSVFLDAQNMKFSLVKLNGRKIKYSNNHKIISITKAFKAGKTYKLELTYSCIPKQTVYFLGWDDAIEGNEQIWTQGQGKYTSHWLPSLDAMEEKVEFDLSIANPLESATVIANGKLKEIKSNHKDGLFTSFDMQKPMSSYLLAFAIGNYEKEKLTSKSGISIENYYYPKDSLRVEPTYRYTKAIFDFLEEEIGVAYPWQNYKQIPVRDFLYAGMENTGTTIFSDGYVIDSTAFIDKNYVNVNAHEMAHQWFGNLVTEKNGNHHWLHEGFATYYAYLAEKELFGDDHFYWKLYTSLEQLQEQIDRGEGASLLDPKASSLTFYEKGAWALFTLRHEIGDKAFNKGIKEYLQKYRFKNVKVCEFLQEMEAASGISLDKFHEFWLKNKEFPVEQAKTILSTYAPSIKHLIDLEAELKSAESDDIDYLKHWNATNSIHLKKYLLGHYKKSLPFEIFQNALASDTIPIRQSGLTNEPFRKFFSKEQLIPFLKEESYLSQEASLFKLWEEFSEGRAEYLDETKDIIGLPNKNIRLMWLTLAIFTEGYNGKLTKQYFNELSSYTAPYHSYEIRQGAFFYIKEVFLFDDPTLISLIEATNHHSWQFRKFARALLDEFLDDKDYKRRLEVLADKLKPTETRYLKSKLKSE